MSVILFKRFEMFRRYNLPFQRHLHFLMQEKIHLVQLMLFNAMY